MKILRSRILLLVLLLIVVLGVSFTLVAKPTKNAANSNNILVLKPPSFVGIASAGDSVIGSHLDEEAGISAYFNDPAGINLNGVRGEFRTIEIETDDYIIGSVPVPNYSENEDAHVYAHKDGWVLAYFLKEDPVSKIVDLVSYQNTGTVDNTNLQGALSVIAAANGSPFETPDYYDFRYPNATHLMVIGESKWDGNDHFSVQLPSEYGYYERSWVIRGSDGYDNQYFKIDGDEIADCSRCRFGYDIIPPSLLLPGETHDIETGDYGALAILYRVP